MGSSCKNVEYHRFVKMLAMPYWPELVLLGGVVLEMLAEHCSANFLFFVLK